jgi:transposase
VAAWGIDMVSIGTAARVAAWSGVTPGHNERANTQRSGKICTGNHIPCAWLTQLAHAAAHTTSTDHSTLDQRLATRRGKKWAIMAVAHSIVTDTFHRLSRHELHRALGAHDFDACPRTQLVHRFT